MAIAPAPFAQLGFLTPANGKSGIASSVSWEGCASQPLPWTRRGCPASWATLVVAWAALLWQREHSCHVGRRRSRRLPGLRFARLHGVRCRMCPCTLRASPATQTADLGSAGHEEKPSVLRLPVPREPKAKAGVAGVLASVRALEDLSSWAAEGNVDFAEKVMATFGHEGSARFRTLSLHLVIKACVRGQKVKRALHWLRTMQRLGLDIPLEVLGISLSGVSPAVDDILQQLQHADASGAFDFDVASCNMLINLCAKEGKVEDAARWFSKMPELRLQPDVITYSTMVKACAVRGDLPSAEQWLSHMRLEKVAPQLITYHSVLTACVNSNDASAAERWLTRIVEDGLSPSARSYNIAINACARCKDLSRAERILDTMKHVSIAPDLTTCNAVILALARADDVKGAEAWLSRMKKCGPSPDVVSFNTVLGTYAKQRDAWSAENCFKAMAQQAINPDAVSYTSLINAFAEKGDSLGAERWLATMVRSRIAPSLVTYRAVLKACARGRGSRRASFWLQEMLAARIDPGVEAFNTVLNAKARNGYMEQAEEWFRLLVDNKHAPDRFSFGAMIDGYARCGDVGMSRRWFQMMQANALEPNLVSYSQLLNACAKSRHPEFDFAEEVFRNLVEAKLTPDCVTLGSLSKALGEERKKELCKELGVSEVDNKPAVKNQAGPRSARQRGPPSSPPPRMRLRTRRQSKRAGGDLDTGGELPPAS